jgi:hypothetical protein
MPWLEARTGLSRLMPSDPTMRLNDPGSSAPMQASECKRRRARERAPGSVSRGLPVDEELRTMRVCRPRRS